MAPAAAPVPPRCRRSRCRCRALLPVLLPLLLPPPPPAAAFNLEASRPVAFRGAPGSLFGFALDFYLPKPRSVSILVGAPKANTSQPNVTQGGAVYHCPWPPGADCTPIDFDHIGTRSHDFGGNGTENPDPVEFKSLQWFGATVRAHNASILACAPLYSWRPTKDEGGRDPVGTCFLSIGNFSKFVEYAPCRSDLNSAAGQGYCQGGFSAEFTQTGRVLLGGPGSYFWQGQVMSATQEQIAASSYPEYFIQDVAGQLQTRQAAPTYDDSYMGYSVAVGEFSGDTTQDFVAGVPKGNLTYGYVTILNGTNMKSLYNFSGEQMAAYFGYAVAATDVNSDGLADLLVGAPLFMERTGDGRVQEVGRVYLYLQRPGGGPLPAPTMAPAPAAALTGPQEFGRFGSAIAPLGDLDLDGFNDVAVGAPLGAEGRQGLVYVYGGSGAGLRPQPSQVLRGLWAPGRHPDFFGAALRGATDLDGNGYPDLLVGAFGVDTAVVYRGRPIVHASASLSVVPTMFNPEERGCVLEGTELHVPCINVSFCLNASGRHLPGPIGFAVELSLDALKAPGGRRALFVGGREPTRSLAVPVPNGGGARCRTMAVFLRNESEFRDKLSPIAVGLSFALDPRAPPDAHGLHPVLAASTRTRLEAKAHIQLDCGEDNVCVPDLQLEAFADRRAVYLGDRNSLNLTFNARNQGEGGAYEAELHVRPPPHAQYTGVLHPHGNFSALSCELGGGNGSSPLVCDLGNPMKAGASIWGGLRFTVPHLSDSSKSIRFELQIRSKNANNSQSEVVPVPLEVRAATRLSAFGVSRPEVVTVPEPGWVAVQPPRRLQDVGPQVEHVYEVVNEGPSAISHGTLELSCPLSHRGHRVLYVTGHSGPRNCTASHPLDSLRLAEQEQEQGQARPAPRRDTRDTGTRGSGPPAPPNTLVRVPRGRVLPAELPPGGAGEAAAGESAPHLPPVGPLLPAAGGAGAGAALRGRVPGAAAALPRAAPPPAHPAPPGGDGAAVGARRGEPRGAGVGGGAGRAAGAAAARPAQLRPLQAGLLQALDAVRHRHGEGAAQAPGGLGGLRGPPHRRRHPDGTTSVTRTAPPASPGRHRTAGVTRTAPLASPRRHRRRHPYGATGVTRTAPPASPVRHRRCHPYGTAPLASPVRHRWRHPYGTAPPSAVVPGTAAALGTVVPGGSDPGHNRARYRHRPGTAGRWGDAGIGHRHHRDGW